MEKPAENTDNAAKALDELSSIIKRVIDKVDAGATEVKE